MAVICSNRNDQGQSRCPHGVIRLGLPCVSQTRKALRKACADPSQHSSDGCRCGQAVVRSSLFATKREGSQRATVAICVPKAWAMSRPIFDILSTAICYGHEYQKFEPCRDLFLISLARPREESAQNFDAVRWWDPVSSTETGGREGRGGSKKVTCTARTNNRPVDFV